jgi:hypothetical protein
MMIPRACFVWMAAMMLLMAGLVPPGAMAQSADAPRADARPAVPWITREVKAPRVSFHTFESAGAKTKVSYHLYTPAAYDASESDDRRFPVVYWLHGSGGGLAGIPQVARHFDAAIEAGKTPPCLVVFVNGLVEGMYVDWKDGTAPLETVIVKDLVPHIDGTYRTIATREGRMLDGFSMGGYGAAAGTHARPDRVAAIRPDLAAMLRPWLATKAPGEQLNLLPDGRAGQVLAADMDTARIAWIAEARTPGERAEREASDFLRHTDAAGRVVDFHGLRVHYISRVVEAGANVKEAMDLARHSDPKLTLKTYAKVSMHNLSRVLDGMPEASRTPTRERETLRATGTHDSSANTEAMAAKCPHQRPHSQHDSVRVSAARRDERDNAPADGADRKPLQIAGLDDEAQRGAASCENAPRRTRTFDPLIKSQLLYQLS